MLHWWRSRGTKKRVLVDLDGVLHRHYRYTGNTPTGKPTEGCKDALQALKDAGYEVLVFTARPCRPTRKWLRQNGFTGLYKRVTNVKWPAIAIFDDRAITIRRNNGKDFQEKVADWINLERLRHPEEPRSKNA